MRSLIVVAGLCWCVWPARAEPPVRTGSIERPRPDPYAGALKHPFERAPRDPYGQARANLALLRPPVALQTTVSAPSGASVLVGGYSSMSSGSRAFGPPLVRPLQNSGQGYSVSSQRIYLRARIIDLREEEERQTGVSR